MIEKEEPGETIVLLPPSAADLSPLRSWRSYSSIDKRRSSWEDLDLNASEADPTDIKTVTKTKSTRRRHLNYVQLGFIAYFAVAAGPFGIEEAVGAAGALPTLLAVVILPITWGLPQALMTAELSTMMDENGGYILVSRLFTETLAGSFKFNTCEYEYM